MSCVLTLRLKDQIIKNMVLVCFFDPQELRPLDSTTIHNYIIFIFLIVCIYFCLYDIVMFVYIYILYFLSLFIVILFEYIIESIHRYTMLS